MHDSQTYFISDLIISETSVYSGNIGCFSQAFHFTFINFLLSEDNTGDLKLPVPKGPTISYFVTGNNHQIPVNNENRNLLPQSNLQKDEL